jgi:hypothetical protein
MEHKILIIFLIIFCGIKLFPQEDTTGEFEDRRNKFIDEGFGFVYLDDELTNYDLFLLRHNNFIKISEYDMGTELLDKDIILEYDSLIVNFQTCEYGTVLGTGYNAMLWGIKSKDEVNYLYGIRHGLTIGELEKIIGKVEIDERYNNVILKNEKKHYVNILFFEEKIIEIVWSIAWFED